MRGNMQLLIVFLIITTVFLPVRRTVCLKYLVLANMLMKSDINPFDSQEAKPYKNDPEILAMTNLVSAYQNNDINEFERILKSNRKTIMDDPFIREHIEGEADSD